MYSSLQDAGLLTGGFLGSGGIAAIVVQVFPETGVGPQSAATSMATSLIVSALVCISLICLVLALRLLHGTRNTAE